MSTRETPARPWLPRTTSCGDRSSMASSSPRTTLSQRTCVRAVTPAAAAWPARAASSAFAVTTYGRVLLGGPERGRPRDIHQIERRRQSFRQIDRYIQCTIRGRAEVDRHHDAVVVHVSPPAVAPSNRRAVGRAGGGLPDRASAASWAAGGANLSRRRRRIAPLPSAVACFESGHDAASLNPDRFLRHVDGGRQVWVRPRGAAPRARDPVERLFGRHRRHAGRGLCADAGGARRAVARRARPPAVGGREARARAAVDRMRRARGNAGGRDLRVRRARARRVRS